MKEEDKRKTGMLLTKLFYAWFHFTKCQSACFFKDVSTNFKDNEIIDSSFNSSTRSFTISFKVEDYRCTLVGSIENAQRSIVINIFYKGRLTFADMEIFKSGTNRETIIGWIQSHLVNKIRENENAC